MELADCRRHMRTMPHMEDKQKCDVVYEQRQNSDQNILIPKHSQTQLKK